MGDGPVSNGRRRGRGAGHGRVSRLGLVSATKKRPRTTPSKVVSDHPVTHPTEVCHWSRENIPSPTVGTSWDTAREQHSVQMPISSNEHLVRPKKTQHNQINGTHTHTHPCEGTEQTRPLRMYAEHVSSTAFRCPSVPMNTSSGPRKHNTIKTIIVTNWHKARCLSKNRHSETPTHTHTHTHAHAIAGQTGTTQDPNARILVSWIVKQDNACSAYSTAIGAFLQHRGQGGHILTPARRLQSTSGCVSQPEACNRPAQELD